MENEACNDFQKTHSTASPHDELQAPGNSVGFMGAQPERLTGLCLEGSMLGLMLYCLEIPTIF